VLQKNTLLRDGKITFQASVRSETNLTMGGGEGKTNYFTSFGYLKDQGYSINSDFERLSTRVSINHEVKSWLKGGVNFGYSYSKSNNNGQSEFRKRFWFADNMPNLSSFEEKLMVVSFKILFMG
jgi:hypothetical protein